LFQRIFGLFVGKGAADAEADSARSAQTWTSVHQGTFRASFAEPSLTGAERQLVESFSDLYYRKIDNFRGLHTIVLSWMGYEMFKCPLDLWVYQEIIVRERPDLIIEVGTYKGGSALYLASVCDLAGHGEIVTIDIDATHDPVTSPAQALTKT
jgi:cephalosporin hydroxylase